LAFALVPRVPDAIETATMVDGYKGHTIVVAGVLDEFTQKYAPMASISWKADDGKRGVYIYDSSPRRFLTQDEAAKFALSEAQKWVDERVKDSG
jgi:hypothetical protein